MEGGLIGKPEGRKGEQMSTVAAIMLIVLGIVMLTLDKKQVDYESFSKVQKALIQVMETQNAQLDREFKNKKKDASESGFIFHDGELSVEPQKGGSKKLDLTPTRESKLL